MSVNHQTLEDVRRTLGQARQALAAPSASRLEETVAPLMEAAQKLRAARGELREPGLRHQVREIEGELNDLRVCAEHTGAFYLGLNTALVSSAGSYNSAGDVAPPPGCHRLLIEG
ncbi:MAG: hypothetical protein GY953_00090 [bacterium]|nr:hypothetical protein [bacterium]